MSNSGAKAALKGYRLQTLYILHEILQSKDSGLIFQPEGNEDLAVYQGEKLVRAVQVKALSDPLTLSDFIVADKADTFIHRSLDLLKSNGSPRVEVISFGTIGNELKSAWSISDKNKAANQNKLRKKLVKLKICNSQIDLLFKSLVWGSVVEEQLDFDISECLRKTLTSGSTEHALSLLTSWLLEASEKRTKITHVILFEKINSIGRYFAEREAHHHEWFKSVTPLESNNTIEKHSLEKEYYRGVSTRFSHIQAQLDILRQDQLTEIDNQFKISQTVIIHGASGQGKTSLAYRYLYEYVPEAWRLQVKFIEDRAHAQTIALAIADQLAIFDATLYLYIDVSPRDPDWTSLVAALLERPNIKILISIREEDLARQNISNDQLGFPALVQLQLSKEEAKHIYFNLIEKGVAKPYPSFEQAWLGFSGNGSLLEYVFFLTQTKSLKGRLSSQVSRLRTEVREGKLEASAIKFLLACAVATSHEARVDIKSLVKTTDLKDPQGTFSLFENEYLIRRTADKIHIEALHPIRSKLLVEVLIDPAFSPWIESALSVLPSIPEADIETFLLYSFVEKPNEFEMLFSNLMKLKIETWGAVAGIGRALLWFGIRNHVIENRDVINSSRLLAGGDGWSLILQQDIGRAIESDPVEDLINIFGKNNPTATERIKVLRQQISAPNTVYRYLEVWLTHMPNNLLAPYSNSDWSGMGEVLLWIDRLDIANELDLSWLLKIDIESTFEDIVPLADLTIGLFSFSYDLYQSFINNNNQKIISIFQTSTQTIWLEQQNNPTIHYIIPAVGTDSDKYTGTYINKMSGTRATILRKLFPDKEKYGTQGYGHQNILMELPLDESHKNIVKSAIPLPQFVSVNSTWANYADYIFRPNDWLEYANNVLSVREQIVKGLTTLNKTLVAYFRKRIPRALIGTGKIDSEYWESLAKINWQLTKLPKLAVDPWGITSEGTLRYDKEQSKNIAIFRTIQNDSTNFRKSLGDYIFPLTNFFSQSNVILVFNGLIGRLPKEQHDELYKRNESLGHIFNEHNTHLSCVNFNDASKNLKRFQHEFRSLFSDLFPHQKLHQLEKTETEKFSKAWALWYQFAHHPEKYWKDSPDIRTSSIITNLNNDLISSVKTSLSNMSDYCMSSSILSENYEYQGKNALWIKVELHDLACMENVLINTVDALTEAVRPVNFSDLKYFVLADLWDNFVIVPTNKGHAVSNSAWVVSTSCFIGSEPVINGEKLYTYLPHPIAPEALTYLEIKNTETATRESLEKLENEVGSIFGIINHIHCFGTLDSNVNETGIEILESYLKPLTESLTCHIHSAGNLIEKAREDISKDSLKICSILELCEHAIQPYEESESNQVNIFGGDCRAWAELLIEALEKLQILKMKIKGS
ncbi:hypothetical protein ABIS04_10225 [Shewanella sp. H8]|uniref:hypothetical protein n=1 Tax=Shewanella sp. H8 TaxID=3342676 RepID=UPI003316286F